MNIPQALSFLEIVVKIIIDRDFINSSCINVISDNDFNADMSSTSFVYLRPVNNIDFEDLLLSAFEICTDYIVQVADPVTFLDVFANMTKRGLSRRSERKLLFLPQEQDNPGIILDVLDHKETAYLPHLIILNPHFEINDCLIFDILTKKFNGPDDGTNKTVVLDRWDACTKSFSENANLFPNDFSDLEGKTLKVAAFNYQPYALLDVNPSIEPLGRDGVEIKIMDEFCRFVNCTLVAVAVHDGQYWGEIFENLTGTGLHGMVLSDETDFAITAMYSWFESWKGLDFSAACIRTAITCLVPAPRILMGYDLPLMPFSSDLWATLLATFIFATIALCIATQTTDRIVMTTFGIMITQSQVFSKDTWRIRSVVIWLLISAFVIDNAYGSGLAAAFTVPKYEKSIDTIQDIVDLNMEWGATQEAWAFSLILSQEPKIKQLVSLFRAHDESVLEQRSFTRDMAFSIEKLPAGHLAVGEYLTQAVTELQIMQEDFYFEESVVMTRKSSPYVGKLNELIGRLHQCGLLLAWESQVVLKYMDFKVQLEVKLSRSKKKTDIEPFTFQHLVGAFIIYFIGAAAAIIMFIGELVHNKYQVRKSKRPLRA